MKNLQRFFPAVLAASLTIAPVFMALPAAAQSDGTDAAIGAAVGAVVGSLLFDQNRNQYYYYQDSRPVYVSRGYARRYYAHHDPGFYRAHEHEFSHDGGRFAQEWHAQHGDGGWHGDHGDHHDGGWQH